MNTKYTREMLEEAVARAKSYADVARFFGLKPHGGSNAHLKARIGSFGIDVSHFAVDVWNRGVPCDWNRKTADQVLVRRRTGRQHGYMLLRALIESGRSGVCEACGQGPIWNGKPLKMQVDHLDGDATNDERQNLMIVCPNCHSQTDNYAGSGRKGEKRICSTCGAGVWKRNKTGYCVSCYNRNGHKGRGG